MNGTIRAECNVGNPVKSGQIVSCGFVCGTMTGLYGWCLNKVILNF